MQKCRAKQLRKLCVDGANKMDIKERKYVKKKNFICLRSGSIGKNYEFIFQEILYFVNLVNTEIKFCQIYFHLHFIRSRICVFNQHAQKYCTTMRHVFSI